ncbi:hypothetical protein D9M68_895630 [compost metagenome]
MVFESTATCGEKRWALLVRLVNFIELAELGVLPLFAASLVILVAASVVQPLAMPLSKLLFGRRFVSLVTIPWLILTGAIRPADCLDFT